MINEGVELNIDVFKFGLFNIYQIRARLGLLLYELSASELNMFKLDTELKLFQAIFYCKLVRMCKKNLLHGSTCQE